MMAGLLQRGVAKAALWCFLCSVICGPAWAGVVQGSAAYRERLALPPDAVFEAFLIDVSRADAAATVLGQARLDPAGQPPFRFEIAYDEASIPPSARLAVRAMVSHQGRLLFVTDRLYSLVVGEREPLQLQLVSARRLPHEPPPHKQPLMPLPASFAGDLSGANSTIRWHLDLFPEGRYQLRLTYLDQPAPNTFDDIGRWTYDRARERLTLRGGRDAPIFLQPVADGAALRKLDVMGEPIRSAHNDRLDRLAEFAPIAPRLHLRGMFSYQADAAQIILCADGRRVPVAMEADYPALEAAYLKVRTRPGEPLLVNLDGALMPRPSPEPGQAAQTTLLVERFVGIWPKQRCRDVAAPPRSRGTAPAQAVSPAPR